MRKVADGFRFDGEPDHIVTYETSGPCIHGIEYSCYVCKVGPLYKPPARKVPPRFWSTKPSTTYPVLASILPRSERFNDRRVYN